MRFKIFSSFKIFSTLPGLVIAAAEVVLLAAESDILAGVGSWATGRLELLSLLLGLAAVLLLSYLPRHILYIIQIIHLQSSQLSQSDVIFSCINRQSLRC